MYPWIRWKIRPIGLDTARHPERRNQNRQKPEMAGSDTEDEDDDEEEMPEETSDRTHDTSAGHNEMDCMNLLQTNPEDDVIQIHTDGEIPQGEDTEHVL